MKPTTEPTRIIALSIGESFAEISLYCQKKRQTIHFERWYLPKEPLKSSLKAFFEKWGKDNNSQISNVFISSRFLEKILSFRLGGSVAQLITNGFENWPYLRQPSKKYNLKNLAGLIFNKTDENSNTQMRNSFYASEELIFGIKERINSKGEVETPLNLEELEAIATKLTEQGIQKVVINFLHSDKNSVHVKATEDFLRSRNFEIFSPLNSSTDEVANWRQNTLNASVAGTFNEIKNEITEAVSEFLPKESIAFITSPFMFFSEDNSLKINSIFAQDQNIKRAHQNKTSKTYLLLGLERFSILRLSDEESYWQSPWGKIAISKVKRTDLISQPTASLFVNAWDEIDFTPSKEGYEPGPMSWGRGQSPLVFDLMAESNLLSPDLQKRVVTSGVQKFEHQLLTLLKNSSHTKTRDVKKAKIELLNLFKHKLMTEIYINCSTQDEIHVGGAFAPVFIKDLEEQLTNFKFTVDSEPINKSQLILDSLGIEYVGK